MLLSLSLEVSLLIAETDKQINKFVPPEDKTLLLIGQDIDTIENYIKHTGIIPAGFITYTSILHLEGLHQPIDIGAGTMHAQYLVDKYPDTVLQIGLYIVGILKNIINGEIDNNIIKLGKWIKKTKRPVYLRIGYEFDFPQNDYDPALYKKAYKHIVDIFRKNNINNAAFVWHSFASHSNKPLINWYPGDDYVDWFGVSFFKKGQLANINFITRLAKKHKKPVMIAEATPFGYNTSKDETAWKGWFKPCFKYIELNKSEMLSYINCNWESFSMWQGQDWGDARIKTNNIIKNRWMEEIQKETYLHSSKELFKILNYTPQ